MTTWYPYTICYRCSIVTESVSPAVCETLSPKHIGVTTHVTSLITWRLDSPYAVSYWCSIETEPLFPSVSKQVIRLQIYLGHDLDLLGVTWRHRARDHLIPPYSISYSWLYLQPFSRYRALNILGSRPWPFMVTWRHRSYDDTILYMQFPICAPFEASP